MTAGIERIRIVSIWRDERIEMAEDLAPAADTLYRQIFEGICLPLHEGEAITKCNKEQARARYDWAEGIDVILSFAHGGRATLQEKFLTFYRSTVTFEERKTSGDDGAWYYCTAQYYFVGYARRWRDEKVCEFQDWILVDLPTLRRLDGQGHIQWQYDQNNGWNGRRATFRYISFANVPSACVVARAQAISVKPTQVPLPTQTRMPF